MCSPECPGAVATRLPVEWQAVQSRQPHSGWAITGMSLVPTVPFLVTWHAAQSAVDDIWIPIGELAIGDSGVVDGASDGVGVGSERPVTDPETAVGRLKAARQVMAAARPI